MFRYLAAGKNPSESKRFLEAQFDESDRGDTRVIVVCRHKRFAYSYFEDFSNIYYKMPYEGNLTNVYSRTTIFDYLSFGWKSIFRSLMDAEKAFNQEFDFKQTFFTKEILLDIQEKYEFYKKNQKDQVKVYSNDPLYNNFTIHEPQEMCVFSCLTDQLFCKDFSSLPLPSPPVATESPSSYTTYLTLSNLGGGLLFIFFFYKLYKLYEWVSEKDHSKKIAEQKNIIEEYKNQLERELKKIHNYTVATPKDFHQFRMHLTNEFNDNFEKEIKKSNHYGSKDEIEEKVSADIETFKSKLYEKYPKKARHISSNLLPDDYWSKKFEEDLKRASRLCDTYKKQYEELEKLCKDSLFLKNKFKSILNLPEDENPYKIQSVLHNMKYNEKNETILRVNEYEAVVQSKLKTLDYALNDKIFKRKSGSRNTSEPLPKSESKKDSKNTYQLLSKTEIAKKERQVNFLERKIKQIENKKEMEEVETQVSDQAAEEGEEKKSNTHSVESHQRSEDTGRNDKRICENVNNTLELYYTFEKSKLEIKSLDENEVSAVSAFLKCIYVSLAFNVRISKEFRNNILYNFDTILGRIKVKENIDDRDLIPMLIEGLAEYVKYIQFYDNGNKVRCLPLKEAPTSRVLKDASVPLYNMIHAHGVFKKKGIEQQDHRESAEAVEEIQNSKVISKSKILSVDFKIFTNDMLEHLRKTFLVKSGVRVQNYRATLIIRHPGHR